MAYNSIIHVLLVDDHAIVREGLAAMLAERAEIKVVGEAGDGHEALKVAGKSKPDVVLLDIRMPHFDGFETLERLQATYPKISVIMLSATAMPREVARARKQGAHGFLLKDADCAELCSAISKVRNGGEHWPPARNRRTKAGRDLSQREIQVLQSARCGLSNAAMARTLKITENAVVSHVKNLLKKLGAYDLAEAIVRGFDRGVLR